MKYSSKKDLWLSALLSIPLVLPVVLTIVFLIHPIQVGVWFLVGALIMGDLLVLILIFPMSYEITPTLILIRSGVIRYRIPLESIQQVVPDHSLGNPSGMSFAWSYDRLRIDVKRLWPACVYIAPKDKAQFLQDLAQHMYGMEVKDGRLIPRQL
jgi:Bacterial PH domain